MDVLVQGGTKVAEGVVLIAKNIVEIAHIRANSAAEVSKIQAQSKGMVKLLRAETEQLMENRKSIRTRGEAAAQVIEQVMKHIPESDAEARRQALNILPQLVRDIVATGEANAIRGGL
jgi:RNA 3'-terminal phosphate cyclase